MSLSDKINILTRVYTRRPTPALEASFKNFIQDELREIEASLKSIADAAPQVAEDAPSSPRKGMVRYAVSPWDPLSNGYQGLVVYNGTAWVQV